MTTIKMDLNINKLETLVGNSSCLLLERNFGNFSSAISVRQEQRVWLTRQAVKAKRTRTAINNANLCMEYEFLLTIEKLVNETTF